MFRELQDSGVADSHGGPGFAVSADSTGMRVSVRSGYALLRGHAVTSTATETLTVTPAAASARVDRVVLRLDPAANAITLAVLPGTPGSATPPSLTRTDTGVFEVPLAQIAVVGGATTIPADAVLDERPFLGHRVGTWTTATRPADPRAGRLGLNTATGRWEFWNGADWTDLAPIVTWGSIVGTPALAPAGHAHGWNEITGKPASYAPATHTHPWEHVTGKPAAYTPTAHRHNAGDIDGTLSIERLPVGGNSSEVARGDHGHGQYATWGHTHDYAPSTHYHGQYLEYYQTIHWADGSGRPRNNGPANGSVTWYAVWVDGNNNFCRNTSSIRYKDNVRDIHVDPADVLALRPRIYDRKPTVDDEGREQDGRKGEFGLVAEEVYRTLPEIVTWHADSDDEESRIDSVRYDLLAVALLSVVQDQERRIKALEAKFGAAE